MKKLALVALGLAYTAVTVVAQKKFSVFVKEMEDLNQTPENIEYIETINVHGHSLNIRESDHVMGYKVNACAFNNNITVTRSLKNKSYYKAVLDHEIGHIVHAPKLSIFSSQVDLYKCELKADEYSVHQGNLEELIKFREENFKATWFAPVQYNTVCLGKLYYLKLKSKLSK